MSAVSYGVCWIFLIFYFSDKLKRGLIKSRRCELITLLGFILPNVSYRHQLVSANSEKLALVTQIVKYVNYTGFKFYSKSDGRYCFFFLMNINKCWIPAGLLLKSAPQLAEIASREWFGGKNVCTGIVSIFRAQSRCSLLSVANRREPCTSIYAAQVFPLYLPSHL